MKLTAIPLVIAALIGVASAAPSASPPSPPLVSRQTDPRYPDMSNNFSCARANQAEQEEAFPGWSYDLAAPDGQQPIFKAWEPILEPVNGCNGLDAGWTKHFTFLVVLDASWVRYYSENAAHFATQGYHSLSESPNLMIDRVSYLFEKQFGVTLKASNIVDFQDLGEACATNNNYVDDGSQRTSTKYHLDQAGVSPLSTDAGILRLGVGTYTGVYCHSAAPLRGVCNKDLVFVNQKRPFAPDSSGKLHYEAISTLAHEMAHFFGLCPNSNPHCLNSHSINELADIMVWDGTPSINARPQGMFRKFMTKCTALYEDTVCDSVKKAPATCAVDVPPIGIAGEYIAAQYGAKTNDWHHVTVSAVTGTSLFQWQNRAGVSWQLTRNSSDAELFHVGEECPYYNGGYKTATLETKTSLGVKTVTGIYGPHNELYTLKSELDLWNTVFCPSGNVDATCWADTAYQICSQDRQGAYDAVMNKSAAGQEAMYSEFVTVTATC